MKKLRMFNKKPKIPVLINNIESNFKNCCKPFLPIINYKMKAFKSFLSIFLPTQTSISANQQDTQFQVYFLSSK